MTKSVAFHKASWLDQVHGALLVPTMSRMSTLSTWQEVELGVEHGLPRGVLVPSTSSRRHGSSLRDMLRSGEGDATTSEQGEP